MRLAIFDFDSTLFDSPVPNRDRLGNFVFGKLMTKSADGNGYGWFQDEITLSKQYTTDIGIGFIESTVVAARTELSRSDTTCILLTGRAEKFRDRVIELCASVGLVFAEYHLKPAQNESTGDFKLRVIDDLITRYSVTNLAIWEDRKKHAVLFGDFINKHPSKCELVINMVESTGRQHLPEQLEREVVDYLIAKNPINQPAKRPNYYGVVLDERSAELVKSLVAVPDGWIWRGHHMTIVVGNRYRDRHDLVEFCDANITQDVVITINSILVNHRSIALSVSTEPHIPTQNNVAHITLCHAPESKPRDSNLLFDPTAIVTRIDGDFPMLSGKITGVY